MERVESAAAMSQRDLATAGENVTAWKVSQATLVSLQVDSWSAVGFQLQEVPTLCQLLAIEGKINAYIHCFVGVQSITTVYDLEVAICKNEGIERFEELGMGPLSCYPLVQHYFFVGSDSVDIFKISAEDVIASLHSFLMQCKRKTVSAEELLDFLAEQKSLPHKQKLGVRIQNLGLHVAYIRRGEQSEKTILNKSLKGFKHKMKERSFRKGQTKGQTKKKKRKRRENHDNTMNKFMRKEEMIDVKRQSDSIKEMIDFKRQSDSIIIVDGYIEDFLTTWKEACRENSAAEVLDMMINFYMTSSTERKKRQIQMIFSTLPGSGLLNVAVTLCLFIDLLGFMANLYLAKHLVFGRKSSGNLVHIFQLIPHPQYDQVLQPYLHASYLNLRPHDTLSSSWLIYTELESVLLAPQDGPVLFEIFYLLPKMDQLQSCYALKSCCNFGVVKMDQLQSCYALKSCSTSTQF
ncbi:uncharacterized protein LOC109835270 [Asparagus officinalis]|uniref:uncharacterized protein LOC109835270 n=1 Tax=Asparagus officinalis TaxID=4686 RepID=UPI00098E3EB3|nr:uncharacterized protein LOC109835270 [Asparagus officinalis]